MKQVVHIYTHNAPTPKDFQEECVRLIKDLNRFDVLRCDKSEEEVKLKTN